MATRIPTASRNAACNAVVDRLDAGSGPGYIEIRVGTQPASAMDAATGTVLATIDLGDPAFGNAGAVTPGVAAANAIATATGSADDTAGWLRAYDSDDNAVIDGAVTISGGGGEMQLNTTTISTGLDIVVTAWTIAMPAA